jgi:hypothetical protein
MQRDIVINIHTSSYKVPFIVATFEWDLNFLNRFLKQDQLSHFIKILSVGAALFYADRRTDMTKPIIAWCSFVNAPKIYSSPVDINQPPKTIKYIIYLFIWE